MQRKEKKMLYFGIFIFIICLTIGLSLSLYIIIPRDTLSEEVKQYYINEAINYFDEKEKNIVTINTLIKSGYAVLKTEFSNYGCNKTTSYIKRENKYIILYTDCKKYTKDFKIKEG